MALWGEPEQEVHCTMTGQKLIMKEFMNMFPRPGQRGWSHFEGRRGRLLARGRVHEVGKHLCLLQEKENSHNNINLEISIRYTCKPAYNRLCKSCGTIDYECDI